MIKVDKMYTFKLEEFDHIVTMTGSDINTLATLLFGYANHLEDTGYPELAARSRADALKIARRLDEDGYYDHLTVDFIMRADTDNIEVGDILRKRGTSAVDECGICTFVNKNSLHIIRDDGSSGKIEPTDRENWYIAGKVSTVNLNMLLNDLRSYVESTL